MLGDGVVPLRIAMLSDRLTFPDDDRDGLAGEVQGSYVTGLARALLARGHDVRIYTRDAGSPHPSTDLPIEYVPAGPASDLPRDDVVRHVGDFGRWLDTRWADGDFRPDVVHGHFWLSGLAALTATAQSRIPVVVTFHGLATAQRHRRGEAAAGPAARPGLERSLGQLADRVIALSAAEVEQLNRFGIPRSSIAMVPPGVDLDRFTPGGPAMPRSGDRHRVLGTGPADPDGRLDLIRAVRRLPDTELIMAGGDCIGSLVSQAGVADRVAVLDAVPGSDLAGWYRSADVACYSSPCPSLAPLEAMACGVPVVGYAVGDLTDCVVDGVTGDLVAPGDSRALARTLHDLLTDRVRRISYGCAAVDRVQARFTWDRAAADVEREYLQTVGRPVTVEP